MSEKKSVEIRVSVDVGYRRHSVAIGLPSGEVLEEFEIAHRPEGFAEFFARIEKHQKVRGCEVAVAMEGFKNLDAEQPVEYEAETTAKGLKATKVVPAKPPAKIAA